MWTASGPRGAGAGPLASARDRRAPWRPRLSPPSCWSRGRGGPACARRFHFEVDPPDCSSSPHDHHGPGDRSPTGGQQNEGGLGVATPRQGSDRSPSATTAGPPRGEDALGGRLGPAGVDRRSQADPRPVNRRRQAGGNLHEGGDRPSEVRRKSKRANRSTSPSSSRTCGK